MISASSSGAAGSRPPSIPRAIMASSCASDIRSATGVMVASSSLGISDATTRTNSTGCVHAAVISAGLPKACHASQRSRKNSSLSLLREPCGRPRGLPDWPGFQGINPRCLCFRTVESLSAASAFDIASNHIQLRRSHLGTQADEIFLTDSRDAIERYPRYPCCDGPGGGGRRCWASTAHTAQTAHFPS